MHAALRATLVSRREELDPFERAFRAWFLRAPAARPRGPTAIEAGISLPRRERVGAPGTGGDAGEQEAGGWSAVERLRTKDFAAMTPSELAQVRDLVAALAVERPLRRSRRLRPSRQGRRLDVRRLVRRSLAAGGDPLERPGRGRVFVPRPLVLVCDVSGSMEPYARALLLFGRGMVGSGRRVEVFAFGTRLTRLTRELAGRDTERALAAVSRRVVDWSGGTRIGASLKALNDEWGRRGSTRGAVVVICSDGWEREDADLVGAEMARLARAAYAIVWVNPLKGNPEYQPLAGGMRAALPYVDRFVSGHDLSSLEELAEVVGAIRRRHAR